MQNVHFLDNDKQMKKEKNIVLSKHIDGDGVHLNGEGSDLLRDNIVDLLNSFCWYYSDDSYCSPTCENTLEINPLASTTTSLSFLASTSGAAIKKAPHCVSLKKSSLTNLGYESFEDWNSDPNHLYIGRNMSHHVAGALGSKWGNPSSMYQNYLLVFL